MTLDTEDMVEVTPIHHVNSGGNLYEYEYTFNRVYPSDTEGELDTVFAEFDCKYEHRGDYIVYQHGDDSPVLLLTQDGAFIDEGSANASLREDAYRALSALDASGYVSGWKKV